MDQDNEPTRPDGILVGMTVLDLTQVMAAPCSTMVLARSVRKVSTSDAIPGRTRIRRGLHEYQ